MSEKARPWLHNVWERSFATEDEADEAYEQFEDWLCDPPFEVDRFDGHTVRVYLDTKVLESRAQWIEASAEHLTTDSKCVCGHKVARHEGEDTHCSVQRCKCRGFERAR